MERENGFGIFFYQPNVPLGRLWHCSSQRDVWLVA